MSLALAFRLLLAALAVAFLSRPLAAQAAPPSVLVIVVDDVGWEDLAAVPLGNIQAFAPLARSYGRCYTCPVCSPSRAGLLTGTYPHRAFIGGALNVADPDLVGLSAATKTLPELLAASGYATGLFGKAHVSGLAGANPSEQGRVHGFEVWRAGHPSNITTSHYSWPRTDDGATRTTTVYSTTAVIDAAVDWWAATPGPKLAVVAPFAPHEPFEAPPAALLPPGYVVGGTNRARFEAALVALDSYLGTLLPVVDLSTTHVVLVCDNGTAHQVPPPGGQANGYKLTCWEGGIRVPLLWWGPGVAPGADATLVQVLDLSTTILDVCGVTPAVGFDDAISFAATLDGTPAGATRRQLAFVSRFSPNGGAAPTLTLDNWAVVREDGWKLVTEGATFALFDLSTDPWEQLALNPSAPGLAPIAADLLNFRAAVLGPLWPY
jgi:arylsulfatase